MSDAAHALPPPPPEPRTPLWLPALGAALFSVAGIGWALSGEPAPVAEAAPAPSAMPSAVVVKPATPPLPSMPAPTTSARPSPRRLPGAFGAPGGSASARPHGHPPLPRPAPPAH